MSRLQCQPRLSLTRQPNEDAATVVTTTQDKGFCLCPTEGYFWGVKNLITDSPDNQIQFTAQLDFLSTRKSSGFTSQATRDPSTNALRHSNARRRKISAQSAKARCSRGSRWCRFTCLADQFKLAREPIRSQLLLKPCALCSQLSSLGLQAGNLQPQAQNQLAKFFDLRVQLTNHWAHMMR